MVALTFSQIFLISLTFEYNQRRDHRDVSVEEQSSYTSYPGNPFVYLNEYPYPVLY
jgi:hypothetical protein